MSNRIYIVGIGPGREEMMTGEAIAALEQADVIVGYTPICFQRVLFYIEQFPLCTVGIGNKSLLEHF